MGRQTQVAMTDEDERAFLAFLRSTAPIQLLESKAPSEELFWVDHFAPRDEGHWQYFIWNRTFDWKAQLGRITEDAIAGKKAGWYYLRNTSDAPLIEYDRHNFAGGGGSARVYWPKPFASEGAAPYDVAAFSKWFDQVVRWIRNNGRQKVRESYSPYFLPGAWEKTFNSR